MAEKKSALIIANSSYEDPILRQLIAPAQDAEALAKVLGDPDICRFEVRTMLDEARQKVEEEIEAFFLDRDRDDLLLLYFSGHGITDEDGLLYYAARNTQHGRLRSTAVAASFVNESMIRCRSRRQVLLLDCCHSGAFARAKAAAAVNAGQHFTGRTPEEGRGRFVLTASDAYQYSFEGDAVEGQAVYSVFTQALTQGLRTGEADLDGDGLIKLDELYSYIHRCVTAQNPRQSPRKWESDVEGGLIIGFNLRPTEAPLPDDLQHAIENLMPEARERAIPRLEKLLQGKHRGLALGAHRALLLLAEDDSRRVSSAAMKSLEAYAQQSSVGEKPSPLAPVTPRIISQSMAKKQDLVTDKSPDKRGESQPRGEVEVACAPEEKLARHGTPPSASVRTEAQESVQPAPAGKGSEWVTKIPGYLAIGLASAGCGASFSGSVLVLHYTWSPDAGFWPFLLAALVLIVGLYATGVLALKRIMTDASGYHRFIPIFVWSLALSIFGILSYGLYFPLVVRNLALMAASGAVLGIGVLWVTQRPRNLSFREIATWGARWGTGWALAWGVAASLFWISQCDFLIFDKYGDDGYFSSIVVRYYAWNRCGFDVAVFTFASTAVLGLLVQLSSRMTKGTYLADGAA